MVRLIVVDRGAIGDIVDLVGAMSRYSRRMVPRAVRVVSGLTCGVSQNIVVVFFAYSGGVLGWRGFGCTARGTMLLPC